MSANLSVRIFWLTQTVQFWMCVAHAASRKVSSARSQSNGCIWVQKFVEEFRSDFVSTPNRAEFFDICQLRSSVAGRGGG